ncbi:MAG: phosphatase PAP2 family protein [Saprospiraceae bacterium]|nr:phosphatase PAP2 family protein [Saprospiraceae bacterium]
MKKTVLLAWLLTIAMASIMAQSPYQLKAGREIGLYSIGLGVAGSGYYFHTKVTPLTAMQIGELRAEGLSTFERWVTTRRSVRSHKTSNVLLHSSNLFPVVLTLADKTMRKDASTIGVLYSQAALINLGLTALVKTTVKRPRPYVYQSELTIEERMTTSARQSFWSGHTSQTATMCFLTARLYADYHPNSKWRPVMWSAAATIPAATGILRMTAGKHFPTDVLAGYVTGAAIGFFLPRLHRRMNE